LTWADEVEDQRRDAEHARQRQSHKERLEQMMHACMAEPLDNHPCPWTWGTAYHDGWFFQFFDANGERVLTDSLRDPEDAALILKTINSS
jgi:hypothetical protein